MNHFKKVIMLSLLGVVLCQASYADSTDVSAERILNAVFDSSTNKLKTTGGGLTIGNAVTGGAANRVLYEDASQNLAVDPDIAFNGSNLTLLKPLNLSTDTATGTTIPAGGIAFGTHFDLYSQLDAGSRQYFNLRSETTNHDSRMAIIPNGTVTGSDTLIAGLKIFGTDFFADETNNNDFGIYVTANSCRFNSKQNGTGTSQPFVFSDQDSDYLMAIYTDQTATTAGTINFYKSHTWFISNSETLATAITNATAGDTLSLASGTYTIVANITINKALNIMGNGKGKTTITSSTNDLNIFNITADNVRISDMDITSTGGGTTSRGIAFVGTSAAVFTNCRVENVKFTMSGAGSQRAIQFNDAGGVVRNCEGSMTSSNSSAFGVYAVNAATAEAVTNVDVYATNMTTVSALTGSRPYYAQDSSAASNVTMNLYSSFGNSTRTAGTNSHAAAADTSKAFLNIYGGSYSGQDQDIININSAGGVVVYNATAVNSLTSGTITFRGNNSNNSLTLGTSTGGIVSSDSAGTILMGGIGNTNNEKIRFNFETYANTVSIDTSTSVASIDTGALGVKTSFIASSSSTGIGWTVGVAANQACNTTCAPAACAFGEDTSVLGSFVACNDATADRCICTRA